VLWKRGRRSAVEVVSVANVAVKSAFCWKGGRMLIPDGDATTFSLLSLLSLEDD